MQVILNGLIYGAAIATLALAFQLVYLPTRILFLGIAALYSLAPYIFLAAQTSGIPDWCAALLSLTSVGVIAALFDRFNHAPLARSGASDAAQMISSLGLYIVVSQGIAIVWGNAPMRLIGNSGKTWRLDSLTLQAAQFEMFLYCSLGLTLILIFLRSSRIGLRLRALADNPNEFHRLGYNASSYRTMIFVLSGVIASISALTTARDIGFAPHSGLQALLPAVVAVIIGGRFSFVGCVIGGFFVGVLQTQVVWQFSARWQEAAVFFVLAVFLLLRPAGLFGHEVRTDTSR